jgi:lambda family phage tail tape measure protein
MANDLVVQLGARLEQFASDMNQAGDIADSAVSRIEQSFANLNPGVSVAGLAGIFTGITGSVGALLASLVSVNSQLSEISHNAELVGVSVERYQQILFAAGQGGVSNKEAVSDLQNVARLLADASVNQNSLTKTLQANNIAYKEANGQVISLDKYIAIAADLVNRFPNLAQKIQGAQALGFSAKWVESLKQGPEAFEAIARSASDVGAVIDAQTIAKAANFDEAWTRSTDLLSKQFKASAADIAASLDDLIDKANDFLTSLAAAQGKSVGESGQATFNAYADAIDIARKDAQGLNQDVDQLTRVIERMEKTGGDPDIIEGLKAARVEAQKTADEIFGMQQLAAKFQFPNGNVPTPAARPAAADAPGPDAAKLAQRGNDAADAYDRAKESVEKYTARIQAEADATGLGARALGEFKAEAQLVTAAQQAGIPITQKVKDQMQDLAQDAGDAAAALAKAKVDLSISRGQQTGLLSPEDVAIANQLKDLYPDVATALASVEAQALRTNQAFSQISSQVSNDLTAGLTDIATGAKSASQGFSDMAKSILRDIEQVIIKLYIVGPLMRTLGIGGGLFGGLTSAGGIAGAIGATSVGGLPLVPAFASGTNSAPGGWSIVGENGPELVNLPRGAQVVPNEVLRAQGAAQTFSPVYNIDARGSQMTESQFRSILAQNNQQVLKQAAAMAPSAVSAAQRRFS